MSTARKASTAKRPPESYQLRIELKGVKPVVWRRILVPATIRLSKLHDVLQAVMGWTDTHLHLFEIGGVEYGRPDPDGLNPMEREDRISLKSALGATARFFYTYDFGDNWVHVIKVEKIFPPGIPMPVPTCLDGRNACPPEDVGGPYGYAEALAAYADPSHERHREMREWIADDFDPTAFDPVAVSARIEPPQRRSSTRF